LSSYAHLFSQITFYFSPKALVSEMQLPFALPDCVYIRSSPFRNFCPTFQLDDDILT